MKHEKTLMAARVFVAKYNTAFLVLVGIALAVFKMRNYIVDGRFWAEEGMIFYASISQAPWLDGVFYLYHGHLELVTNVIVLISTVFEFEYAPRITTYISWVFQYLPIYLLVQHRERLGVSSLGAMVFLVCMTGLPQSSEVWANSINLHFHFALLAVLIASIPIYEGYPKYVFRMLLLLAGLSGIPANFLLPLFVGQAAISRVPEHIVQAFIISITSIIQFSLLVTNGFDVGDRDLSFAPVELWLAILAQQVLSPLFGFEVGDQLANILRRALSGDMGATLFAIVCSIPVFLFCRMIFVVKFRPLMIFIFSAALLVFFSVATSLGDKSLLISSSAGGRYFFAPNALVILCVVAIANRTRNLFCFVFIALLLISSISRVGHFMGGNPWLESYKYSSQKKSESIDIWPAGWKMKNFNNEL